MASFHSFNLQKLVHVHRFSEDWTRVRFLGPVIGYYVLRFQLQISYARRLPIQKLCLDWHPAQQTFVSEICPYRQAGLEGQVNYISNAIIRPLQQQMPLSLPEHTRYERTLRHDVQGRAGYLKQRSSQSWTPVRVLRIPKGLAMRIQSASLDIRECELADPQRGHDVLIRFDGEKRSHEMYDFRIKERSELTSEELRYLRHPLNVVKAETLEQATMEWARLQPLLVRDSVTFEL
jgi:hypothetical protein